MKIAKSRKEKIRNTINNVGRVTLGFCAGATLVGVAAAVRLNKKSLLIQELEESEKILGIGCEAYRAKNRDLQHEIDIRDCMVMEGIDGDTDIFARRMEHFRDYKIQTTDLEQNEEDCKEYCMEAAFDAEVAYNNYLNSLKSFTSDVPVITEDDELPF